MGIGLTVNLNDPAHIGHSNHVISCDGKYAERIWVPDTPILESVKIELLNICQSHRLERCGFIDSQWEVWQVSNRHKKPQSNFYMDREETGLVLDQVYKDRQESIIAIWHTHPNDHPWPTPRDIHGWPNPALNWRYLIVTNNEVIEWKLA